MSDLGNSKEPDEQDPNDNNFSDRPGEGNSAGDSRFGFFGFNPEDLQSSGFFTNMPDFSQLVDTIKSMFNPKQDGSALDWKATENQIKKLISSETDTQISANQRDLISDAYRLADNWLDDATCFPKIDMPCQVWTGHDWVELTSPVWKSIAAPIVDGFAKASESLITDTFTSQTEEMPEISGLSNLIGPLIRSSMGQVYSDQIAKTIAKLAQSTLTGTEIGFQVLPNPQVGILPANVAPFSSGLGIQLQDLTIYLLIRESARQRLFNSVAWLAPQILAMVEHFAREAKLDEDALTSSLSQVDPSQFDPEEFQKAATEFQIKLMQPEPTAQQTEILDRLETLLALVEGWVDEITAQATQKWMQNAPQLAEIVRRRRATESPAENVLSTLVGLKLKPRRVRDAANLWAALTEARGSDGRDQVWHHPDLIPTANDLADPIGFVQGENRDSATDDWDASLSKLLEEEGRKD